MLRLLLTPLRWLLRSLLYGCLIIAVMLVVAPFALNLPAHADQVLAALNDGQLRGLRIRALPAGAGGFPPELEIRNLQVTSVAGGPAQVAMVAASVRVGLNVVESLSRGEPVMVAMVENPVIYADAPLNLGSISTAITQITGIATQIQLIGGEIINPATSTTVALGDNVVQVGGRTDDQVADLGSGGAAGGGLSGSVLPGLGGGLLTGTTATGNGNSGNTNQGGTSGNGVGTTTPPGIPSTPSTGGGGVTVPGVTPTVPGGTTSPGGGTVPGGTTSPGGGTVPGGTTSPGGGTVPGGTTSPGGGTVPGGTTSPGGGTVPGGTTSPGGGTVPGGTTSPGGGTVPGGTTSPGGGTVPGGTTSPGGGTVPGGTTSPGGGTVPGGTTSPGGGTVPGGTTSPGGGTVPGGTTPGICTCPCGF
jgi:hypothetical protein